MLIAAVAMASLFASAATACNCSHHEQPRIDETSSCHSHSHTKAVIEGGESTSAKSLQSPCECVLVKPAPAVTAKSDAEIWQMQPDTAALAADAPLFKQRPAAFESGPTIERDRPVYYSKWLASLRPSRAPPRL